MPNRRQFLGRLAQSAAAIVAGVTLGRFVGGEEDDRQVIYIGPGAEIDPACATNFRKVTWTPIGQEPTFNGDWFVQGGEDESDIPLDAFDGQLTEVRA